MSSYTATFRVANEERLDRCLATNSQLTALALGYALLGGLKEGAPPPECEETLLRVQGLEIKVTEEAQILSLN